MSLQQASDMTKEKLLEWRMAILWFMFFTVVSLASAINASMVNADWNTMDKQGVLEMVLNIIIVWGTTMMAFFSKAAKKVEGDLGLDDSTVKQIKQVNTQEVTTTQITPKV